jgi:hypothetical protein
MSFNKPSLYNYYSEHGDVRGLVDLIEKYEYSNEEASEVINIYGSDENGKIPEVEHIEVLLLYFPKSIISQETFDAIQQSFPKRVEHIKELQNRSVNEEVFIVNLNEKSFFRYLKKDETDSGYNKLLLNLLTPPNVNTKISHWMRTDKIVFAPKHLHKYVEQTYNELGKTAF